MHDTINVTIDRSIIDRIIGVESGGDPNARTKVPGQTASGLGGFTDGTWLATLKSAMPTLVAGMTDAAILALKTDPQIARAATEALTEQNAMGLRKAGFAADPTNIYLAHFLGLTDALKVLSAQANTALQGLISQKSINANPDVLSGKTTTDVINSPQQDGGRLAREHRRAAEGRRRCAATASRY